MRPITVSLILRAAARPALAFAVGLLCVLCAAELALRLPGTGLLPRFAKLDQYPMVWGMVDPGPARPEAFRILCAGNSHTQGAAETVKGSFPNQLEELLRERYPSRDFQVINVGLGNWNSSEVLEHLPGFLSRYRPQVVFAMIGEPNFWNYRFLPGRGGWLADNLRRLKIVRLLDLLRRFDPKEQGGTMPVAPDPIPSSPWIEYPQLATGWVAYLDRHPDLSEVAPADLEVARVALERWTRHERGRHKRRALSTLVAIDLHLGRRDGAVAAARQLLGVPGKPYDYFLHRALQGAGASLPADLLAEVESREPGKNWLARLTAPSAADLASEAFLESAVAAAPGDFRFVEPLARLYRARGNASHAIELYAAALAENPGALGLDNRLLESFAPEVRTRILMSGVFPPLIRLTDVTGGSFGEGDSTTAPGLSDPGELETELGRVRRWEESDLRRLSQVVSDFGAQLVLQTYPLYRKTLKERWPDPLIRAAAGAGGIPLSDTSRAFEALFRDHPSEEYYFKKNHAVQDDHLNTKGNRVVAELMLEKLREMGIVP